MAPLKPGDANLATYYIRGGVETLDQFSDLEIFHGYPPIVLDPTLT
jgi:hypothetical protein